MSIELQSTLSLILQQLADFFGLSVDAITANAPEWLSKYGWYCLFGDLAEAIVISILLGGLILFGIFLFIGLILEIEELKVYASITIFVMLVALAIGVGIPIIRCYVAPEIYGLEALMKLINK